MKKFYQLLAICLLAFPQVKAQWSAVYTNPNIIMAEIQFTSDMTGYVLGTYIDTNQALLLKTTDGGNTWGEIPLNIPFAHCIDFLNDSTGYVISGGSPGKILFSSNGFSTWITNDLTDGSFEALDLHATSDSTGIFLLNEGRTESFDHYGATSSTNNALGQYFKYAPVSLLECYMLTPTEVYRTIDGGLNWDLVSGTSFQTWDAAFTSMSTGYFITAVSLTTDRIISKTTDGGLTFPTSYNFPAQNITAAGDIVVAISDTGNIMWSNDAGASWAYETTGTMPLVACKLALTPDKHCFFANAYEGAIYRRNPIPLSVKDTKQRLAFSCYPNPAGDYVRISMGALPQEPADYSVTDITGRVMLKGRMSPDVQVALSGLNKGIYFVNLVSRKGKGTVKLYHY